MKYLVSIFASLILISAAQAATVDSASSEFIWTGTKVTGKHFGKLPLKSSKIKVEKGKVVGGEFILDLEKMTVDDLKGKWKKKFLEHVKGSEFFELSKWPTAKLVIEKLDGKMASGKLTIKDKTNPVKFPYTVSKGTYSGSLKFDRTKFGMVYGSGDFFKNLGDKMIHNDVTLAFKVKVNKK